jgi:hypothetical protein
MEKTGKARNLDRRPAAGRVSESKLHSDAFEIVFPARITGVFSFPAELAQMLHRSCAVRCEIA